MVAEDSRAPPGEAHRGLRQRRAPARSEAVQPALLGAAAASARFLDAQSDAVYKYPVTAALARLTEATAWIREADEAAARGAALDYQRMFALTTIAILWTQILVAIQDKDGGFYESKRKMARFYMEQILPETAALHEIVMRGAESLTSFDVSDF